MLVGARVALGIAAMAVDHLLGDDPGLEDPPAFLISAAVILVIGPSSSAAWSGIHAIQVVRASSSRCWP